MQEAVIDTQGLKKQPAKNCTTDTTECDTVNRWSVTEIVALFELPFSDLIYRAQTVHRENFDPNAVQVSTLLSIKTGGCSEDCGYCPQAARYHTEVEDEPLPTAQEVCGLRADFRLCQAVPWLDFANSSIESSDRLRLRCYGAT